MGRYLSGNKRANAVDMPYNSSVACRAIRKTGISRREASEHRLNRLFSLKALS